MTDTLPEPAIAARHQGNRASEIHKLSPCIGGAVVSQPPVRTVCYPEEGAGKPFPRWMKPVLVMTGEGQPSTSSA
jgi:hypothetical protein